MIGARQLRGPQAVRCSSSNVPEPTVTVQHRHSRVARNTTAVIAEAASPAATTAGLPSGLPVGLAVAGGVALAAYGLKQIYDNPSRTYDGNVGDEYDAWTDEGILEYYWGEHIHLGWYTEEERQKGWWKADFKAAKLRFTQEMFRFSGSKSPKRILDVGCGFGGSSRWLASQFPDAEVTGITLSHKQVERGTQLAKERGLNNVTFKVMDALAMEFDDDTFDLVWACESGEHMPDKKKYVEEMTRVLAPGGNMVIACWCQREETPDRPLSDADKARLQFLYDEWAHPFFISIQDFCRLMEGTGKMESVSAEDWTPQTLPSWRHSNLVGVLDPWFVMFKWNPKLWYKVTREIVTLERMHRAFDMGLMEYGLMRGVKAPVGGAAAAAAATGQQQQQATAAA